MILFRDCQHLLQGGSIRTGFRLGAGERLDLALCCSDGGGEAVLDIDIDGPDAQLNLYGLYLCSGTDSLNIKVNLRHNCGGSNSFQLFKGIVKDSARAVFDGLVMVAPEAQKTEALQTNRNLLLSEGAMVQSSPQLEIYADDVKCSHGATSGNLSPDEQFYMRSRGISLAQARRLQMISFLAPVAEHFPEDCREHFSKILEQW